MAVLKDNLELQEDKFSIKINSTSDLPKMLINLSKMIENASEEKLQNSSEELKRLEDYLVEAKKNLITLL